MNVSESYIEMLNRSFRSAQLEGSRPYPVAALEITLLNEAQRIAAEREQALFGQLCQIFDWQMSRRQKKKYLQSLKEGMTLVLTDLSKTILWTSRNFLTLTGYTTSEVLGKTPALLQGRDTNMGLMQNVSKRLRQARSVDVKVRNHRKNGDSYLCQILIDPLRNTQGELTHFLAVEYELAEV